MQSFSVHSTEIVTVSLIVTSYCVFFFFSSESISSLTARIGVHCVVEEHAPHERLSLVLLINIYEWCGFVRAENMNVT